MSNTEFDVVMLGPSGIGKTSILATMYNEIKNNINAIFSINSTDDTKTDLLNDKLNQLQAQIMECKPSCIMENYVEGTKEIEKTPFAVTLHNETSPRFNINFYDHRGDIITSKNEGAKAQLAELKKILRPAHVVINPVDACVLTETPFLHGIYANPGHIAELLQDAFNDDQNQLLIIALTKCETYLEDPSLYDKMRKNLEDYHKRVFSAIKNLGNMKGKQNILTAIVPIKTIGGIQFQYYKKDESNPSNIIYKYFFGSDKFKLGFKPEMADFIFYLTIAFLMREAWLNKGFWSIIIDMFGGRKKFVDAVNGSIDIVNRYYTEKSHRIELIGNLSLLDKVK